MSPDRNIFNQYSLLGDVFLRQKIEFIIAVLFLAGLIVVSRNITKYVSSTQVEKQKDLVILDAGHGDTDPGKIGVNKAKEKDINLVIAEKVKCLLEEKGISVVMTWVDDSSLAEEGASNKKIEDMKARVALINKESPRIAVSIHQNSYHEEKVSGAQVFYYSHSEEGKEAAELMQKALLACDSENTRQAKANDTYYLLKRTEVPTIIVECGFLSNWQEAELLVTEEYQDKIAEAICQGILDYLEK